MNLRVCGGVTGLKGEVRLPGDKSISHRAIVMAGMTRGTSRLRGVLQAGVTRALMSCLEGLGAETHALAADDLLIVAHPWESPKSVLECANSGATMRMLLGALAPAGIQATLDGGERLRQRPMSRVVEPLRQMGANITGRDGTDQPPLTVGTARLHGIDYQMPVASAQVKTAILLAGLSAEGPTILHERARSRDHTERLMRRLGVPIRVMNGDIVLDPDGAGHAPFDLEIPGDLSSAAFLIAAAILVPDSKISLPMVGVNPTRTGLIDTLREMGADLRLPHLRQNGWEDVGTLVARSSELQPTSVEGERVVRMIDEFPIFAVLATQADGVSVASDAAELRLKESDRIASLADELRRMGAAIETRADGFEIEGPTRLRGAAVDSHGDHRLAMALTVAGLIAEGETTIQDAECIDESFPGFAQILTGMGAELA
jgi:3-phosphoshikimate 1-carboxyvinyltransferase